uniref:Uncharacterized protein n=1 Tax=Arundo donax TaxID=35708 RepID=A0A0A8Y1H9_ARUDO
MKERRGMGFCSGSGKKMRPTSALTGTTRCGNCGTARRIAGRGFLRTRASRYL